MITYTPILLLNFIIVLLIGLATILWRLTKRNKLQKTLIAITALWAAMFLGLLIDMLRVYNGMNQPIIGVMNFHYIWMGLIGLFSLISYPAVVLHQKIFNVRKSLIYLSPVLLTLGVYVIWHLWTGVSMNYRYLNYAELWTNRFTVPVILRSLMLLFFVVYLVFTLFSFWRLVPVYEKYSDDNYADTAYNMSWLRLVIAAIGSICTAYLVVLIWEIPIVELIYAIVTSAFFICLAVDAFSRKLFTESEFVDLDWSVRGGWQFIEKPFEIEKIEESGIEAQFNAWIESEKPFTSSDFTANNVYDVFPALRYPVLTTLLARRGHTFKSYVRELRVAEACRILEENPDLLCKQVAFQVGLSSSQVLSRSFISLIGKSPIEFRKK